MNNFMVDIETLGTGPTSLILSIGAVQFDPHSKEIGKEDFHADISIESCLKAGLTIDASTIRWWMTQSDDARKIFTRQGQALSIHAALLAFTQYLLRNSKKPIIWCNGSNFDAPILDNAFRQCEMLSPWEYYNVRDFRTLKAMIGKETFDALRVKPEVAHDALHDALSQAKTLQNIFALSHVQQT